jgi:hypothetical protein
MNKKEIIQDWLKNHVVNYKNYELPKFINGFNEFIKKPDLKSSTDLCYDNFIKWTEYVKTKNIKNKSLIDEITELTLEIDKMQESYFSLDQNSEERIRLKSYILIKNSKLLELRGEQTI